MNGQSTYRSVLLTVCAVLAAAGLYMLVDAQSLAKQQAAEAQKSLDRLAAAIEQQRNRESVPAPAANAAAATRDDQRLVGAFDRLADRLDALEKRLAAAPPAGRADAAPERDIVSITLPEDTLTALPFALRADAEDAINAALRDAEGGAIVHVSLPAVDGTALLVSVARTRLEQAARLLRPFAIDAGASKPEAAQAGDGAEKTTAKAETGTGAETKTGNAAGKSATATGGFANDAYRDPDAVAGDGRVVYTASFPGNLNPLIENEAFAGGIHALCVSSLAVRDLMDITRFEPLMAESWTVSEDGLVYTIRLRDGFQWQPYTDPVTGDKVPARPVTADDFAFYWEIIQNRDVPCEAQRGYFVDMQHIRAKDARTLEVRWKQAYSLAEEWTLGLQPWPRHYYRPDPATTDAAFAEEFVTSPRNRMLVGTGPYRLAGWNRDRELVLERDPGFGGSAPALERLVYRLIGDPEIALLEFKNRRLDAIGLMPVQWRNQSPKPEFLLVTPDAETAAEDSAAFDRAKKDGTAPDTHLFEKYQYPGSAWFYLGYNMRRPVFADREVRLAMTHLVDRKRILREVQLGLGQVISGPFLPRSPYYDPAIEPWPYDPDRAREILRDAGWLDIDGDGYLERPGPGAGDEPLPLAFTLIVPQSNPNLRKIAALVEQDARAAGVRLSVKMLEWSVYLQQLDNFDYDACILAWSGGVEGDPFQIWHSSQSLNVSGSNHVGYRSDEADALIEKGRRTLDKQERYAIYRRFHALLHHDQPYTFLFAPTSTQAIDKRYRNLRVYRGGMDIKLHWVPAELQRSVGY